MVLGKARSKKVFAVPWPAVSSKTFGIDSLIYELHSEWGRRIGTRSFAYGLAGIGSQVYARRRSIFSAVFRRSIIVTRKRNREMDHACVTLNWVRDTFGGSQCSIVTRCLRPVARGTPRASIVLDRHSRSQRPPAFTGQRSLRSQLCRWVHRRIWSTTCHGPEAPCYVRIPPRCHTPPLN